MRAGLPGTGLQRATGQAAVSAGVLLALFATGWLLGLMIAPDVDTGSGGVHATQAVIRWLVVAGTAALLIGVLLAVEALQRYLQARARQSSVRPKRRTRKAA